MTYERDVEITGEYDVAVCGGGCAGFTAALQSAREGAKTCIIEKNNMLGGVMTTGRNNEIALFNAGDIPVIRGIGWEFVKRLEEMGYAHIPPFKSGIPHYKQGVQVNIPMAAYLLDEMCIHDNVSLYYMTTVVDVVKESDYWLLITASKAGLYGIYARKIIDCTGDGDICCYAGAQYELGDERNGDIQPGTLGFYVEAGDTGKIEEKKVKEAFKIALEDGTILSNDIWLRNATPMHVLKHKGNNINHILIDRNYEKKEQRLKLREEGQ